MSGKGDTGPKVRVVSPADPAVEPAMPPRVRWLIDDWKKRVVFKPDVQVLAPKVVNNAVMLLLHRSDLAGLFVLNKRTQRVSVMFQPPWTTTGDYPRLRGDADIVGLQCYLETDIGGGLRLTKSSVADAIDYAAHERSVDPVLEKLQALQWDGTGRLDHWCVDYLGAEDTSFVRAAGAKWMIAAVARIIRPGSKFDHVLVLEGEQGTLKSTALRVLAAELGEDTFTDRLSRIDAKDSMVELVGRVIVELAELTVLKRADYDEAKGFLSRQYDDVRLPYARTTSRLLRGCVFAGTVNPDGIGWLKDPTGNRRYWPIAVKDIDIAGLTDCAAQLWAEAKTRFDAGERWWIEDDAVLLQATQATQERTEEDVWADLIDDFCTNRTQVRIEAIMEALGIDKSRQTMSDQKRVGAHLRRRGWRKGVSRATGDSRKWWFAPRDRDQTEKESTPLAPS